MTETLPVPTSTQLSMRIARQETATAAQWAAREQQLKTELDEHQARSDAERAAIDAEVQEFVAKARQRIEAMEQEHRRISGELADAGRRREHHAYEADEANHAVLDWCTRHGVDPDKLPQPSETSGPLPALPAYEEPNGLLALGQQMARPEANGSPDVTRTDFPVQAATADPRAELPGGDGAEAPFQGGAGADA